MAITDTQKVDYLWKKIGYGRAKTDTGTLKSATNESISSPLLLRGDKIWAQSDLIPAVLPGSTSGVVTVYPTSAPVECDVDITSSTNRTWKTNITDWIPPEIGSTYLVKVYLHTPGSAGSAASSGTQIFGAGSGNNDEWFFDYQSGTLNFIGTNLPSGISGKSVYISGGVYNGLFGVSAPGGGASFTDLFISGISTLSGLLYANSGADIKNIRIGIATDNKIDTTTGNLILDSSSGFTEISDNLYVSGFSTFVGVGTFQSDLYVGGNLGVKGYSEFVGVVTFKGGTINLGDDDTDNIVVSGEFASSLIPTDDATYNLGTSAKRWNDAAFAGIGTFDSGIDANNIRIGADDANKITTSSGNLILDPAGSVIIQDNVIVQNDLTVNGNVTIGGTTITLRGEDVFIENKDIVLGYTTSITPNDTTANHAGVAVASTEGSPLVSFAVSGINTLPDTYKQLMWFQNGTLGFATDAFAFNYAVAVGTTVMANGVRFAVGSGITMTDTDISASNFYGALTGNASSADQVKTVTASDTDSNYHITFVDSNNGSATNVSVYTDNDIYYNPGTNKLTTQHAEFTADVLVSGITTLAGNVFLGDSGSDTVTVIGVTTFTTSNVYINNQLYVGGLQVTGGVAIGEDITTRNLLATGITTVGTGVGITQFSSVVSTGTSTTSVPTSSAVIDYVSAADIGLAGDTGSGSVNTTQTLTISGTANEVNTSVSDQTVTVGLPDDVIVGTSLSAPTVKVTTIQHSNGTQAAVIDASGNVGVTTNLTVSGNLYVNGSTTQVNTTSLNVEDRTIELGIVDGSAPSATTTWDLGVLFNYYQDSAKKSAVVWEQTDARFKFASVVSDGGGIGVDNPQITFTSFAPIEIGALWVNDCAGQSQVISCTGTERFLENITVDAGTF